MLLMLLACTGNETEVTKLEPDLIVNVEELDFGEVKVDEELIQSLQLINAGQSSLLVESLSLTGDGSSSYSINEEGFELAVGDILELPVSFIPSELETFSASLSIISNDDDTPEMSIPLVGIGGLGPLPDIQLSVESLDFGDIFPGNETLLFFNINNEGDAPLQIENTLQAGSGAFQLLTDIDGQEISPNGVTSIMVNYVPFLENGDQGTLSIESNDPDEPTISIEFIGNGGGEFSYPEAILDCPSNPALFSTVTLDGSTSTDPDGENLEYHWNLLQKPLDSSVNVDAGTAVDSIDLELDVPGDYHIGLIVENESGVPSAQAECLLEVETPSDIYVTLSWGESQADFDLHLLTQADGIFQFASDCCWCNSTPNWGSSSDDSPVLLRDSQDGSDAEIMDLFSAPDGEYYVRVHYFSDNGAGTSDATARIYIAGQLAGQYTQTMTHNQVWDIGFVRWPEKVLAEELLEPYILEGSRSCQ